MSKRTVVTDYIQNKLAHLKRDQFLDEISKEPLFRQRNFITDEIKNINDYISLIKDNKNSYEMIDGKKKLKSAIKNYIKSLRQIISKYQQYIKYLNLLDSYSNREERLSERIKFESWDVTLSNNQLRLLDTITSNSIKNISFTDLVKISKYMINNFEVLENHNLLFEILKEIINRFLDNNYNEEDYVFISSIKSTLTYKINSLNKDDKLRKPLHQMKKFVKSSLERSQDVLEDTHDYRYEIVEYLMENEYYFNRILEDLPDTVNLTDKEGYSLVYNIISKYLDQYLLELQGKKTDIPKEKYARMYRKIINLPEYQNNKENSYEIEVLINNFKETIKHGKFKRDKYLQVLNDLDNIKKEDVSIIDDEQQFDKVQLLSEHQSILNRTNISKRVDLTNEDTIVITTNGVQYHNYAYSVSKDLKGQHILKVHVTAVREFIKHDSELNNWLKHYMFYNDDHWLDDKLLNKFSLEKNKIKQAITFELKVLPSGGVEEFCIYKSNIKVNDIYLATDVHDMIKKHNLRFLTFSEIAFFLDKNMNKDNYGISITETFNKTILDLIGKFFQDNNLPYIYRIQDKQNSETYMNNMTFLNNLFTKISKNDFNKFYQIICEDTNYARYTSDCMHHFLLNQKYYTDLFIPLYSYIGIHIQELINQFYFKELSDETLKFKKIIWQKENAYLIERANRLKEQKRIDKHKHKMKVLREKLYE